MTDTPEGPERNPLRDFLIRAEIQTHPGEEVTVENLAKYLPSDFDLRDDDLAPFIEAPVEFEGEAPQAQTNAKPIIETLAEVKAETEPEPEPITAEQIEAAVTRRREAEQNLANRRVDLLKADTVVRAARDALSKAVSAFQSGFAPISREKLMRDYISSEQARKAAGHQSAPQGRPGKSVVDRMAFYSRGGSPARGSYQRGAYPSQLKGAKNYDPRRGPVAKLPEQA
jgi:hypothetical protein